MRRGIAAHERIADSMEYICSDVKQFVNAAKKGKGDDEEEEHEDEEEE